MKEMKRQGDLLFVSIDKIPNTAKKAKSGILAHGEVTGHKHEVSLDDCDVFVDEKGNMFLEAKSDCAVTHDTHAPVEIEKNSTMEVFRQREYDPIAEERERQVRD